MEGELIFDAGDHLFMQGSGHSPGNFTVTISESNIEITDHLNNTVKVLEQPPFRILNIETGNGNDIIHLETREKLRSPFMVHIYTTGGDKLIVGAKDPMLQLQVKHSGGRHILLPDGEPGTYERHEAEIRQWNEEQRKPDGLFKRIKRKLIYFFGRDLRFSRPFSLKEMIRKPLPSLKPDGSPKAAFFTTRRQLDQLEAIARPGDILLRYQDGYPFDKYFVGIWQHAGLYVKKGRVIDAMGNGTYLRTMDEFGQADGIVLLRIGHVSAEQVNRALSYAYEQIGKWYSVDFDDNITEQYCSGLIVNAYKYAGVLEAAYKKQVSIHPDGLLALPGAEIVWTNRPDLLKKALKSRQAGFILQQDKQG